MTKRTTRKVKGGVGYGRPPLHTRFKPGQSGNPRGRKKGSRSVASIISSSFDRKVIVTENGRTRKVYVLDAVIIRIQQDALKGDAKAAALYIKLAQAFSSPDGAADQHALTAEDHKLLANFVARQIRKHGDEK